MLNGAEHISTLGKWSALAEGGTTLLTLIFGLFQEGHVFMRIVKNENDNHLFDLHLGLSGF